MLGGCFFSKKYCDIFAKSTMAFSNVHGSEYAVIYGLGFLIVVTNYAVTMP